MPAISLFLQIDAAAQSEYVTRKRRTTGFHRPVSSSGCVAVSAALAPVLSDRPQGEGREAGDRKIIPEHVTGQDPHGAKAFPW